MLKNTGNSFAPICAPRRNFVKGAVAGSIAMSATTLHAATAKATGGLGRHIYPAVPGRRGRSANLLEAGAPVFLDNA